MRELCLSPHQLARLTRDAQQDQGSGFSSLATLFVVSTLPKNTFPKACSQARRLVQTRLSSTALSVTLMYLKRIARNHRGW